MFQYFNLFLWTYSSYWHWDQFSGSFSSTYSRWSWVLCEQNLHAQIFLTFSLLITYELGPWKMHMFLRHVFNNITMLIFQAVTLSKELFIIQRPVKKWYTDSPTYNGHDSVSFWGHLQNIIYWWVLWYTSPKKKTFSLL